MGRCLRIEWKHSEAQLKKAYLAQKRPLPRTRLHFLWLVRRGKSLAEAAEIVGHPYGSAKRWLRYYRQGGLEAVESRRGVGKGRAWRLTPEQRAAVCEPRAPWVLPRPRRRRAGSRSSLAPPTAPGAPTNSCAGCGWP